MDPNDLAKEIIANMMHITVATSSADGQPWNSPVYSAYDEGYNFYWTSDKNNQHSQNIRSNPHVFIVIYDSTGVLGNKTGVYILAEAHELDDPAEIAAARACLQKRKGKDPDGHEQFVGDHVRRVYKAVPKEFWINDAERRDGDFIRDFRIAVDPRQPR